MTVQASDANTERVFSKGFAGTSWNGTSRPLLDSFGGSHDRSRPLWIHRSIEGSCVVYSNGSEAPRRGRLQAGADYKPYVAQNWAQTLVSEKQDEADLLKDGEPGRTPTCNPLSPHSILSY